MLEKSLTFFSTKMYEFLTNNYSILEARKLAKNEMFKFISENLISEDIVYEDLSTNDKITF